MRILALTHIYPRNEGDNRGVFIRQLYDRMAARHSIRVLVPKTPEPADPVRAKGSPEVLPFGYFVPTRYARFGHGGALTGDQRLTRGSLAMAPLYGMAAALRVARLRREADLIHAHFLVPNGSIAALAKGKKPLAISLHGSDVYIAERFRPLRRAARLALSRAAAIIPCSEDLAERVIALGAPASKVTVIPYGADSSRFRAADPARRTRLRAELGLDDRPVALFVGNLVPKKGVIHLLRAAALVHRKRPDAAFVLVGDGPLRSELATEAARLDLPDQFLRFVGARPWAEIPGWLAAADLFVAPSVVDAAGNVDGLPNVVLEAMATSLPVVASRVAGIPMAVADGATGLLTPPGDEPKLAEALLALLGDRERGRALGEAGRKRLLEDLTWERIAARYETVFGSLLSSPAA